MAHHTARSGYQDFVNRLNRFPQGAPPSDSLFEILKILMSEEEARLLALIPIKPFKAQQAAKAWKIPVSQAKNTLERLAGKAILLDAEQNGETIYALPPPMAGFFEFSLMRVRNDINQKALAELFHQYLNVEEDFIKSLFANGETQIGRTFVQEASITAENALHVLDYERASHVIQSAKLIGVGVCYCRHKMEHVGKNCDAPMDICMTFGNTADALIRHEFARIVSSSECMDLLHQAYDHNLVQFGENVRNHVSFICNCCGCCCEAMIAARKFGIMQPVHTTNFVPVIDETSCSGCMKCVQVCPVEALSACSANDPKYPKKIKAGLDESLCLGCGVCVRVCPSKSISLASRPKRVITPVNGVHRVVVMAIERGKLQNLIFDHHALFSHRAMAAILGVILKLPPVKQIMASKQMKSRYLETLIGKIKI
jgi:Pyruvate/2-oxoacid:ferredoxin oxidoreductase delta subunit